MAAEAPLRPAWVGSSPQRLGGNFQMEVVTGPYQSAMECEADMPKELQQAVGQYLAVYLSQEGSEAASHVQLPLEYVRSNIVKEEWVEPMEVSVGPMVRLHALLQFDREVNARVDEEWARVVKNQRLGAVGVIFGAVLLALSLAWGYLRVDLATAGKYRWRLRFVVFLAILAIGAAWRAVVH